jgi:hypothetical protein
VALRSRLDLYLAPEAEPEPLVRYREGLPALRSFATFVMLLAPPAAAVFVLAGSANGPTWLLPLAVGLPAFAFAFLLPRRRRHQVALGVALIDLMLAVSVLVLFLLYLLAASQCPPDAYECPF